MVAGGIRLNKISTSDAESAVYTVVNSPKGFNFNGFPVKEVFEENHKHWVKVYSAGKPAGPLIGAQYRPQDVFDTNGFHDSELPVH